MIKSISSCASVRRCCAPRMSMSCSHVLLLFDSLRESRRVPQISADLRNTILAACFQAEVRISANLRRKLHEQSRKHLQQSGARSVLLRLDWLACAGLSTRARVRHASTISCVSAPDCTGPHTGIPARGFAKRQPNSDEKVAKRLAVGRSLRRYPYVGASDD